MWTGSFLFVFAQNGLLDYESLMPAASLSIVAPFYNEEAGIAEFRRRVSALADSWSGAVQVVCVDDGSRDRTLSQLRSWADDDPRLTVVELSRNFGHQRALLAGLDRADGDFVAVIDGDLQDPPEVILDMVAMIQRERADVAYGVRRNRKEGVAKRGAYWFAYRALERLLDIDLPLDAGDFCVMRRRVNQVVISMREQSLFLRGLRAWVGFRQLPFPYDRDARHAGESKYRWKDLLKLGLDGIFSFTSVPIRLLGLIGVLVVGVTSIYLLYLLGAWLGGAPFPRGFATLVLLMIFFGGIQLMGLHIVGSYVYRAYLEVRRRPLYITRHENPPLAPPISGGDEAFGSGPTPTSSLPVDETFDTRSPSD